MMFFYDHGMSWWAYAGMATGTLLFWALMIVGTVALIRYLSGGASAGQAVPQPTPPQPAPSAAQILAARFARGEISETEYRERLAALDDSMPR